MGNLVFQQALINKIIVQTELLDFASEYNTTTGLFTPVSSGTYAYEITVTTSSTATLSPSGAVANNLVFGLTNNTTNLWIGRFQVEATVAPRTYYLKGVLELVAGTSYYFGMTSSLSAVKITALPTGATGSGVGTFFSISRLK